MSKNIQFKIQITQKNTLQCSYIDANNKERSIEINNKQEFPLEFLTDLIHHPEEFTVYQIQFQNKIVCISFDSLIFHKQYILRLYKTIFFVYVYV